MINKDSSMNKNFFLLNFEEDKGSFVDFRSGKWTLDEHKSFLTGVVTFKKDWQKIQAEVGTRHALQIKVYAQKFVEVFGKRLNRLKSKEFSQDVEVTELEKLVHEILSDEILPEEALFSETNLKALNFNSLESARGEINETHLLINNNMKKIVSYLDNHQGAETRSDFSNKDITLKNFIDCNNTFIRENLYSLDLTDKATLGRKRVNLLNKKANDILKDYLSKKSYRGLEI